MMTRTYDIEAVANQFTRLLAGNPEYVDMAKSQNWRPTAGFSGTEYDEEYYEKHGRFHSVGWYDDSVGTGEPILEIAAEDVQKAGETLAGMESVNSPMEIEEALKAAGIRCK